MKKVKRTMPLKIKNILFFGMLFLILQVDAQDKPILLEGDVKYNTFNLADINVVNKTSKIGALSNNQGKFTISAVKGDSIMFSSLEYQNRIIVITASHINKKAITVYLEPGFNELDEVEILQKIRLEFNNIAIDNRTVLDNDVVSEYKAPDTDQYLNQGYMNNGMSLVGIYNLITKKSRAKKRTENDEKNQIEHFKNELPNTLKNLYGIDFFTDWLYIPLNEVDLFLDYCQGNGLGDYYNNNEFEVKNFLVIQSQNYNKIKK